MSEFVFNFYPGDYLRDTQCLSPSAQVAYDRIMCEHMRNICISQKQHNFFTKRLTEDEREELSMVLTECEGGFQIDWVVASIQKRQAYSESRRKNRTSKPSKSDKKDMNNISSSYVNHMENENEIEKEVVKEDEPEKKKKPRELIRHKAKPKDLQMVVDYFKEQKIKDPKVNAEKFYAHYEANGWYRGTTKIRDWKACVKTWKLPKEGSAPDRYAKHRKPVKKQE